MLSVRTRVTTVRCTTAVRLINVEHSVTSCTSRKNRRLDTAFDMSRQDVARLTIGDHLLPATPEVTTAGKQGAIASLELGPPGMPAAAT
jgi:hypothetical protein